MSGLKAMRVGPCIYCGEAVTEADSWGQLDDEYPPREPYHLDCKFKAAMRRLEAERAAAPPGGQGEPR